MQLIDGKQVATLIQDHIRQEVQALQAKGHKAPHLAAILVGNDAPSETYVNGKVKACQSVGFGSTLLRFAETISEAELLYQIEKLNQNPDIDGFIVQLPLPKHIDVVKVTEAIDYRKDVDGFHPINVGRMAKNLPAFISATPLGILKLLEHYQIDTTGKHCVVLGRSHIVGSPMSILMARNTPVGNATVTICHSKTKDLAQYTKQADILIAAIGIPEFVTADMVKEGAVVIDVGINRVNDSSRKSGFRLVGDVNFAQVSPKCGAISPVPGGVGPMTITALMYNTLLSAQRRVYT